MRNRTIIFAVVLAAFIVAPMKKAAAVPVEIIQTGQGTGKIGDTNFANAKFTITSFSDTSTRTTFKLDGTSTFWLVNSSSFINIESVGSFRFLSGSNSFSSPTNDIAGYAYSQVPSAFPYPENQYDLFWSPSDPALANWDMTTSLGPVSGTGQLLQWTFNAVQTDGGVITFQSGTTNETFQAIVGVPEPATLIPAIAALFLFRRNGKRRTACLANGRALHQ